MDLRSDPSRPATFNRDWHVYQGRFTWQAAPKHKIGITYDIEDTCTCNSNVSATTSPEAGSEFNFPLQRFVQVDWNSPVTNRLLIEASGIHRVERWGGMHLQSGAGDVAVPDARMIGVNEQTTGLNYRASPGGFLGAPPFNNSWNVNLHYRAAMSYITGSHQVKVGFNNAWGHHENTPYALNPAYVFTGGRPLQIRQWAIPYRPKSTWTRIWASTPRTSGRSGATRSPPASASTTSPTAIRRRRSDRACWCRTAISSSTRGPTTP